MTPERFRASAHARFQHALREAWVKSVWGEGATLGPMVTLEELEERGIVGPEFRRAMEGNDPGFVQRLGQRPLTPRMGVRVPHPELCIQSHANMEG